MIYTALTQFAASESGEKAGGFAALGLDLGAFIVQFVTFLIVFWILKKYVFWRIVEVLDKRQKTIEDGVRSAQEMTQEKEKLEKEVAKIKAEARDKADEILAESKAQSDEILTKATESAETKTDKMIADAKKKIEEESERSRRDLKSEVVSLVVDTTEKLIGFKVDASKDKAIIDEALKADGGKS